MHNQFEQPFLPISRADMQRRGWDELDIVLINGDAYVDHPAFGAAVIGRVLEHAGYRVGIISMPDWRNPDSVTVLGKPRLCFGVTAGNVDSMLAHYTAFLKKRHDDPYVPGGKTGGKPQRAVIVYCNLVKAKYKDVPIIIGGIEASMRRIAHYDYWSNRVRRSILLDSRADMLVHGMGEQAIVTAAQRLQTGANLQGIPGTVCISATQPDGAVLLPVEEDVVASKKAFSECCRLFYRHQHELMVQPTGKRFLVHNPSPAISSAELDSIYELPYVRAPHPSYSEPVPAFDMIKYSVLAHRGCVSGCSFCSLSLHQGKRIVSRSKESVLREVALLAERTDFSGHITDIGGPSANMYGFQCKKNWRCKRESCTFPQLCPNLQFATESWLDLLERARQIRNVKRVTIGSGIRYDLFLRDPKGRKLLRKFIRNHISGQLKIAPEHTSPRVLRAMRKPPQFNLNEFVQLYREINQQEGKRQHLIPYLMSNHPGCEMREMQTMKQDIRREFGFVPDQVQSFIPLPMTLSSVMYYTGSDPLTGESFPIARDLRTKQKQHRIFFEKPAKRHR
ncbi:YgiQ family radical SAM protein [candidate division KSB1 bacterium]|nr:YgiQ family radical SAM protein [candidate division KSB1 bacterium]